MVRGELVCGSTHEMWNRQARFQNCHRRSIVGRRWVTRLHPVCSRFDIAAANAVWMSGSYSCGALRANRAVHVGNRQEEESHIFDPLR